jgi:hypothetical protein
MFFLNLEIYKRLHLPMRLAAYHVSLQTRKTVPQKKLAITTIEKLRNADSDEQDASSP